MSAPVEYDAFAEIYEVWVESAPAAERNLPFYIEEALRTKGTVVELGVGDGRIAIPIAEQGKPIIGVDSSAVMLARCRARAEATGVADLITLIQADFRDFVLPQPAELITIPFHTIGHLVSMDDKRAGLHHIWSQLAPGGRLIFDAFVPSEEYMRANHNRLSLRAEYTDMASGRDVLLWVCVRYDFDAQTIHIITFTDELDEEGVVERRKCRRLSFSYLYPEQARALLEETGFKVEALYGDFDRRPFDEGSSEHIWVARRHQGNDGGFWDMMR